MSGIFINRISTAGQGMELGGTSFAKQRMGDPAVTASGPPLSTTVTRSSSSLTQPCRQVGDRKPEEALFIQF